MAFDAGQLEDMLRTSTKNVAQEVVSAIVYSRKGGVLSEILSELNKHKCAPGRGPSEATSGSKQNRSTPRGREEGTAEDEELAPKEGEQLNSASKRSNFNNRRPSRKIVFKAGEETGTARKL